MDGYLKKLSTAPVLIEKLHANLKTRYEAIKDTVPLECRFIEAFMPELASALVRQINAKRFLPDDDPDQVVNEQDEANKTVKAIASGAYEKLLEQLKDHRTAYRLLGRCINHCIEAIMETYPDVDRLEMIVPPQVTQTSAASKPSR